MSGRSGQLAAGLVACLGLALAGVLVPVQQSSAVTLTRDDDTNVIIGLSTDHMWSDDGVTWVRATPQDTFPGTRSVTVADYNGWWADLDAWRSTADYPTAGWRVVHNGKVWRAQWYAAAGEEPGVADAWAEVPAQPVREIVTFRFTPWAGEQAQRYQLDQQTAERGMTKVVGYYPEWGRYQAHDYFEVADVNFDQITHLNYAFGVLAQDGDEWKVTVADEWAARNWDNGWGSYDWASFLTERHGVRNMLSIGGWTNSANGEFEAATATAEKSAALAEQAVAFMVEHGFTGLDLDWEYPEDETSGAQFARLVADLRAELTAQGLRDDAYYPLSIAVTPHHAKMPYIVPEKTVDLVDSVNVMSYDYHGAFDPVTGHNSPLRSSPIDADAKLNIEATMAEYLEVYGIPKDRLLVGIPYYGRAWGDVEPTELLPGLPGLGAPGTESVHGQWDDRDQFTGTNPYRALKKMAQDPQYTRYWDAAAQVPYLYNATTKQFFTYDDAASVQKKVDFIQADGYGGAIIWDLSGDTEDHELGAIVATLLPGGANPAEGFAITGEPQDLTVREGGTASFTVQATEVEGAIIHWEQSSDGVTWDRVAASGSAWTLSLPDRSSADDGTLYRAVVTHGGDEVVSHAGALFIADDERLAITTQPTDITVAVGETAQFTVEVDDPTGVSVRWQYSDTGGRTWSDSVEPSADAWTTTIPSITADRSGDLFRAVITRGSERLVSGVATLTVTG